MDAMEGLVLGALAIIVLVATFALGSVQTMEKVADACERMGAFETQGTVYDCKRRVTP